MVSTWLGELSFNPLWTRRIWRFIRHKTTKANSKAFDIYSRFLTGSKSSKNAFREDSDIRKPKNYTRLKQWSVWIYDTKTRLPVWCPYLLFTQKFRIYTEKKIFYEIPKWLWKNSEGVMKREFYCSVGKIIVFSQFIKCYSRNILE